MPTLKLLESLFDGPSTLVDVASIPAPSAPAPRTSVPLTSVSGSTGYSWWGGSGWTLELRTVADKASKDGIYLTLADLQAAMPYFGKKEQKAAREIFTRFFADLDAEPATETPLPAAPNGTGLTLRQRLRDRNRVEVDAGFGNAYVVKGFGFSPAVEVAKTLLLRVRPGDLVVATYRDGSTGMLAADAQGQLEITMGGAVRALPRQRLAVLRPTGVPGELPQIVDRLELDERS